MKKVVIIKKILLYLSGVFVITVCILLMIKDFDKLISGHPYGLPMILGILFGFGFSIIWGGYLCE